jgi:protein-tyrosine phosphatase
MPVTNGIPLGSPPLTVVTINYAEPLKGKFQKTAIKITQGKEELHLNHWWFTAWPDHGVPTNPDKSFDLDGILQYIEAVQRSAAEQQQTRNYTPPQLVHCSAGVGRTGVMIALQHAMHIMQTESWCDPLEIIQLLRNDRCLMVQQVAQYEFLHAAIKRYAAVQGQEIKVGKKPKPKKAKKEKSAADLRKARMKEKRAAEGVEVDADGKMIPPPPEVDPTEQAAYESALAQHGTAMLDHGAALHSHAAAMDSHAAAVEAHARAVEAAKDADARDAARAAGRMLVKLDAEGGSLGMNFERETADAKHMTVTGLKPGGIADESGEVEIGMLIYSVNGNVLKWDATKDDVKQNISRLSVVTFEFILPVAPVLLFETNFGKGSFTNFMTSLPRGKLHNLGLHDDRVLEEGVESDDDGYGFEA